MQAWNVVLIRMPKPTRIENFWGKVAKSDGCWLWTGVTLNFGHGWLTYAGKKWVASRFSWFLANGPIPDGQCVLHRCDVPACVRPSHLFLGTQTDNMQDRAAKGHYPKGETHQWAKLSEDDVRFIRKRYAEGGISQPELGRMFGVTHKAIGLIIHRKNWAHVA